MRGVTFHSLLHFIAPALDLLACLLSWLEITACLHSWRTREAIKAAISRREGKQANIYSEWSYNTIFKLEVFLENQIDVRFKEIQFRQLSLPYVFNVKLNAIWQEFDPLLVWWELVTEWFGNSQWLLIPILNKSTNLNWNKVLKIYL